MSASLLFIRKRGLSVISLKVLQIDIGRPSPAFPVTPPCVRVRTRRFGELSYLTTKLGSPSDTK